ncbi:hypothetical protein RE6C_04350 [Rhodopirellula europaea 6C]|uniref:Uncharacterized protein n=1 Tax=Rhodopirellula europaea 6C TaxID=1263867 RepID=M2AQ90_9BACT|nr:hypothetical protein RE6C_04350 [Rhodopirellula europaea 6C]
MRVRNLGLIGPVVSVVLIEKLPADFVVRIEKSSARTVPGRLAKPEGLFLVSRDVV